MRHRHNQQKDHQANKPRFFFGLMGHLAEVAVFCFEGRILVIFG